MNVAGKRFSNKKRLYFYLGKLGSYMSINCVERIMEQNSCQHTSQCSGYLNPLFLPATKGISSRSAPQGA